MIMQSAGDSNLPVVFALGCKMKCRATFLIRPADGVDPRAPPVYFHLPNCQTLSAFLNCMSTHYIAPGLARRVLIVLG